MLLATVEVPGWITGVAAGPDGVWACLERRGEPGGGVVELTPNGGGRTVDLSELDVSEYLRTTRPG